MDYYGKTVLDKYFEEWSKEDFESICRLATEFFKHKYGYSIKKL